MPMPKPMLIAAAAIFAASGVQAQERAEPGKWGSGYQMGTAWAGVTSNGGLRVTAFCGDKEAAAANPAIPAGPSLQIAVSKVTPAKNTKAIRLVIDGKVAELPVRVEPVPDAVNFDWKPSRAFDAKKMSLVLANLRKAESAKVQVAGAERELPLAGVQDALSDDIVACK